MKMPAGGLVQYSTSAEGREQVHTRCLGGYALGGDALRTCVNGTWNGTAAFCSRK